MGRLERELGEIVSERFGGDFGIIDEYRKRLGVRGALAKLARGWLIERARSKRLQARLDGIKAGLRESANMVVIDPFDDGQACLAEELLEGHFG